MGGGLFVYSGTVTVDNVTFNNNQAIGGSSSGGYEGGGGGMAGGGSGNAGGGGLFAVSTVSTGTDGYDGIDAVSSDRTTITFTPDNWNQPQTIFLPVKGAIACAAAWVTTCYLETLVATTYLAKPVPILLALASALGERA